MRYHEIVQEKSSKEDPEQIKARAEAQGFDTSKVWYHGTTRKFPAFKIGKNGIDELGPGIYFTGEDWAAQAWARGPNGRIIACYLRRGEYFDLARFRNDPQLSKAWNDKRWRAIVDELHPKHSTMMTKLYGANGAYSRDGFEKYFLGNMLTTHISTLLAKIGYTGAYDHESQIPDQIVIFNPKDARRIDAKFHPEKADSERLLDGFDPAEIA